MEIANEPYCGLLIVDEWIYEPTRGKVYLKEWRDYVFDKLGV